MDRAHIVKRWNAKAITESICSRHDYSGSDFLTRKRLVAQAARKPNLEPPTTDCRHCWAIYYSWIAADHTKTADQIADELRNSEIARDKAFGSYRRKLKNKRDAWARKRDAKKAVDGASDGSPRRDDWFKGD